ncbi:MAG: DUF4276 family protein [Bryobacterales bacterium]|nr:DUF4276 family protein [Bryobacterales bacterium]
MTRIYVIVEGATEESFVKGPLAEALWPHNVSLVPIILGVPGHRGGRTSYARMQKDLLKQLKQDSKAYCSTMIDFYGLGPGFPGGPLDGLPPIRQVEKIEQGIKDDICDLIPKHRPDERLIPYLSLHEFESLLFSDPGGFARALNQPSLAPGLSAVRSGFSTPEDINDSPNTAPSKRVERIYPAYRKVIEGTLAARAVGIDAMRRECPHFRRWFEQLAALGRT